MVTIQPQFITDSNGNKISAVIPIDEFELLMEELEDLDDIRLYDEAKKNDTGERISATDAYKIIEEKRK